MHTDPTICPRCGHNNHCAIPANQAAERCWCLQQARVKNLPCTTTAKAAYCFCADCLKVHKNNE